jgi:hypothetical protein
LCKLLCTVLNVGKVARFYNGPSYHESTLVLDKKVLGVVPCLSKGIVTVPVSVIGAGRFSSFLFFYQSYLDHVVS